MQKTKVCVNPFVNSMPTDDTQDNNKNIPYLINPFTKIFLDPSCSFHESKVGGSNTNPSTDYVHPLQRNGSLFKDYSSHPSLFSNAIPSNRNHSKHTGNPFSNETTETASNIQNKNHEINHSVDTKKESIHDNTNNVDKEKKNDNSYSRLFCNQKIFKHYNDPLDNLKNDNINDNEIIAMQNINKNKGLSLEEIKAKEMYLRKKNNKDNECGARNIISFNDVFAPKKTIFEQPSFNDVLVLEQPKNVRQFNNIDKERRLSEDNTSLHTRYDHLMKNQTIKPDMNDYMTIVVGIKEPSFTTFAIRIQKDTSFFNFKQSICKILQLRDARFMNFTPNMFYLKKNIYIVKETAKLKQSSIKNNDSLIIILKENAVIDS